MAKYRAKAKPSSVKPKRRQPAQGRSLETMLAELLDEKQYPSGENTDLAINVRESLLRVTIAKALGGDNLCLNKLLDLMRAHDVGAPKYVLSEYPVSREKIERALGRRNKSTDTGSRHPSYQDLLSSFKNERAE